VAKIPRPVNGREQQHEAAGSGGFRGKIKYVKRHIDKVDTAKAEMVTTTRYRLLDIANVIMWDWEAGTGKIKNTHAQLYIKHDKNDDKRNKITTKCSK